MINLIKVEVSDIEVKRYVIGLEEMKNFELLKNLRKFDIC